MTFIVGWFLSWAALLLLALLAPRLGRAKADPPLKPGPLHGPERCLDGGDHQLELGPTDAIEGSEQPTKGPLP